MPTYYKPTERRGKRVVWKSLDPDEPKREWKIINGVLIGFFLFGVLIIAISYWSK